MLTTAGRRNNAEAAASICRRGLLFRSKRQRGRKTGETVDGICAQFALHQVNSRLQSRVRVTTECMELNMPHLCHVVTHEVCRWPRLRLFVSCQLRQSRTRLNTQAVRQGAPHQALA